MGTTLRRGKTLLTQNTKDWNETEWNWNEAQERSKIFTDFFESNQGGSRRLVCSMDPQHPQYNELADKICLAVNSHDDLLKQLQRAKSIIDVFVPMEILGREDFKKSYNEIEETILKSQTT